MAKYQQFLSRIGSNRDRAALRGIFSQFLTDGDPPALKDLVLASIVLSGAETTQITISGACTTGVLLSATSTTGINITGAATDGIKIQTGAMTDAIEIASVCTIGLNISGACATPVSITGACTTGIAISSICTTGISLTGAMTTGIDFTSITLALDANRTNSAIAIGDRLGAKIITMAAAVNHLDPMQINLSIAGVNPTSGSTVNGIYQLITHSTTAMASLRLKNADWNLAISKNVLDAYVFQGEIDYSGTTVVGGESAVMGLVMNAGAGAITGFLRGVIISMQGAAAAATCIGLEIRTTMGAGLGSGLAEGIRISGTPLPIVGIAFGNQTNNNEGPQFAFFFPSTPGADIGPWSATNASGDAGKIAIKLGANTKYINLYNS